MPYTYFEAHSVPDGKANMSSWQLLRLVMSFYLHDKIEL